MRQVAQIRWGPMQSSWQKAPHCRQITMAPRILHSHGGGGSPPIIIPGAPGSAPPVTLLSAPLAFRVTAWWEPSPALAGLPRTKWTPTPIPAICGGKGGADDALGAPSPTPVLCTSMYCPKLLLVVEPSCAIGVLSATYEILRVMINHFVNIWRNFDCFARFKLLLSVGRNYIIMCVFQSQRSL